LAASAKKLLREAAASAMQKWWGSIQPINLEPAAPPVDGPGPAVLEVWPSTVQNKLSDQFYSLFLETEINFGGEGGLLADQVWNGDFETLGRGMRWWKPDDEDDPILQDDKEMHKRGTVDGETVDLAEPLPNASDFRPWTSVGGASLAIVREGRGANPHVLKISGGKEGSGAANPGYWGIGLRGGVAQEVSLRAKAGGPTLRAQLCVDGAVLAGADLKPKGPARGGWQTYTAMLRPDPVPVGKASRSAELRLLVPPNSEATIDHVSLVPTDAVAGLFRKDIFDALKALRPGFVRFPGGDYLEGTGPRTRWDWKRTIGQPSDRKGHYNSAWDYWVRDRLGFFEMLQLAEALGSEPVLAVPTGLQLNKLHYGITRYGDPPANSSWAQEALDAIEFATAPAQGSNWGGFRAAMGRSEPFKLTKVEVGNEERTDKNMVPDPETGYVGLTRGATGEKPDAAGGYSGRYRAITDALWKRYPDMTVIASGQWKEEYDMSGNPCLNGQRCDMWDEHFYRSPDDMVGELLGRYDKENYDRATRPKVFVGEYSAIPSTPPKNDNTNTLIAAVAEASFALSLERNADVVKATAFAPVLANVGGSQWPHVLLKFDSDRLVRTPSYYALQMLRNSLGTHTVRQAARGGIDTWSASVSVLEGDGKTVAVKLANYCASSQEVEVKLHDAQILRLDATTMAPDTAMALWGAPNYLGKAQEYVSRPERNESDVVEEVAPRPLQVNTTQADLNGGRLRVFLPGWSFSVVHVVLR
jgi:alpha-N-arabinofuranosidase